VAHTDDEHLEIAELLAAVEAYETLARRALAREAGSEGRRVGA